MNIEEKQYLTILQKILDSWSENLDRTWIGTLSTFWERMEFDLSKGKFPLLTTKKTFLKGVISELLWLIRGDTNIKFMLERGIHIWTEWAYQHYLKITNQDSIYPKYTEIWTEKMKWFENEVLTNSEFCNQYWSLWPVYGSQWRNFNWDWIDQLKDVIDHIKNNPTSRRHIVTAWNPSKIKNMLLPPCHMTFQFYVNTKLNQLDLQLYQRSADYPLWVPFNIASYSLLLLLISKITGYTPWRFIHITGDSHIYLNQIDWIKIQLEREPYDFPEIFIKKEIKSLEDLEKLEIEDFEILNYKSYPWIKMPIAV